MIDPASVTNYNRTQSELEEFLLFSIAVAGKNSETTAKALDKFLWHLENSLVWIEGKQSGTPFHNIRGLKHPGVLGAVLKRCGFGCFNQRAKSFLSAANSGIDLGACSISQLEEIHGVGKKTSRFFIMHTRPDTRLAVLDVHILHWLRDQGIDAPKQTPGSSRRYIELECQFLNKADELNRDPAELDLEIWNTYSKAAK